MVIKIIGGDFKRRRLGKIDRNIYVRPILARVKKSLFDIIRAKVAGGRFLDLYAGSGAVGIEALSRGAAFTVFIDSEKSCVRLIKSMLARFDAEDRSKVSLANVLDGLEWLRYKELSPFDVVFLGPPYREYLVNRTLKAIEYADILAPGGWVIAQHHKKEPVNPEKLAVFRQKKYGDTLLTFMNLGSAEKGDADEKDG